MSIPKQIEETAELAEQLHSQMFTNNEQTENVNIPDEQQAEPQEPEAPQEDTSLEEKWEQRYKSLQGKYNAEVPRLQHELSELKQSIIDRLGQSNLQQQVKEEPAPQTNPVLDKFREEYGDDLLEAIKQVAKLEVDPIVQERFKPVQEQVASVEETQVTAARNNFVGFLDSQVKGNWKDAWSGNDPDFLDFLQSADPSGLYTYGDLVNQYNDNWDGERLAKVFNIYYDAKEPPKPPKQPDPAQTAMVAPSRTNTHSTPSSSDKPIWNKSSIEQFQREDRAGKYDAETSMNMWNDLLAAMSEGRIR